MQTLNGQFVDDSQSFQQASYQRRGKHSPFRWWFNLTALPEPQEDATFVQKEAARKSRLISIVAGFLLVLFALYLPADIILKNIPPLISTTAILPVALIAILLNRSGRTFLAGLVIVCSAELVFSMVILTTMPFDVPDVQSYGLLVIGELLTVSLLSSRTVFVAAFYNSLVIAISLLYQSKTLAMTQEAQHQFAALLLNPVGVQFLVAGVTYLWVSGTLKAIARADHAEVVASLEREIGQQATIVAEEKLRLEAKINEVVQFHINTMNNGLAARFPFSEETKMLWPLINVIHSLQRRVQRAAQTSSELERLKQAIMDYTDFFYSNNLAQHEQWPQTKTELDPLLYAMMQQMHKHSEQVSPGANPVSNSGNPISNGWNPISSAGNPVSNGWNPVSSAGNPVSSAGNPVAYEWNPVTKGWNPGTNRRSPATNGLTTRKL